MTFFKGIIKKIFSDERAFSIHKENFALSVSEEDRVKQWMDSREGREVFKRLFEGYHLQKTGIDEPGIHLMSSPYANGIAITYEYPLMDKTFSNLFFALGFSMLDLGYYRVSLDRTFKETAGGVKIMKKQYFKPPGHTFDDRQIDQRFGNVSIENVSIDNRFSFLKVLVTVYSGRQYQSARPFEQFMESLLNR